MGNKAPWTTADQSVVELEAGAQRIFGRIKPSTIALISAGFEDAAEHILQQVDLMRGEVIEVTATGNISLYTPRKIFTVVIQITWRLCKADLYVYDITDKPFSTISFTFWK